MGRGRLAFLRQMACFCSTLSPSGARGDIHTMHPRGLLAPVLLLPLAAGVALAAQTPGFLA